MVFLPHGGVYAALFKKLVVLSFLGDLAVPDDEDAIHVPHRGQAVGDHQHGLALHQRLEGLLYLRLVLRVCKGAGLIQHHDGRVL